MLAAIVIAGSKSRASKHELAVASNSALRSSDDWCSWIASIPVLGCSTVARTVESIRRAGVDEISVLGQTAPAIRYSGEVTEPCRSEEDAWRSTAQLIRSYRQKAFHAILILRLGSYIECEFSTLFEQHRQNGEPVTRVFDQVGPLDLWVVDPRRFDEGGDLLDSLQTAETADFSVGGYVNRLHNAHDLRQLASDILSLRCRVRPNGTEVRPGLWIAEGAQIARSARLVAPAYIGKGVKVADDCLITRCSTVEANSYVDFGTAVEDSSILPETYVGIGLDLSHSVVEGSEILNLQHNVRLRISDPVVLRRNATRAQHDSQTVFEAKDVVLSSIERQ
jgi:carbonic anhydrase/acetyltransferase-like protein (isoleucine patch superfamily)